MADNVKTGSDGKVYEMLWDCKFCGTKKLLGKTHRFCPNCGGQQDPSWRYFPADSEKVAVQDHVYVGADKVCPACKSLSAGSAEFCGNCGSPLDRAAAAQLIANRKTGEGQEFDTENLKERQQAAQNPQAQTTPKPQSGGINKLWIILGVIAVVVVGGILFTVFSTKTNTVSVTGFRWEREIRVETLQAVPGKTKCENMPVGAYNVDRNYEQVGSHSEPDGQTCQRKQVDQGDGTFREEQECKTKYKEVPDYGYMCSYVVNTWAYSRSLTAQGDKTVAVTWPKENLSTGSCLGCEREASRNETYYLQFTNDGKAFECPVSADEWNATKLEQGFTIKIGTVLKDARCDTLEPVK